MGFEFDKEQVARRIKSGLADKGMTQEELAEKIGVSRYTVTEWCAGRNGFSFENACAIADAFCWPLDRLACRDE